MPTTPDTIRTIDAFIGDHHVLTLATVCDGAPSACNLFYAYDPEQNLFIVASSETTEHIRNVLENPRVGGTVVLETDTVGLIRGLQFTATMRRATRTEGMRYFKAFPYALAMRPALWALELQSMKYTDNRLGFGTKLNWKRGDASA